jgi:CubicO group peptidase (beta-lactamase class C family)
MANERVSAKIPRRTFLHRLGLSAAGVGLASSFPVCCTTEAAFASKLPRSTPEEQGVASEGVLAFLDAVGNSKHELHSFMMLRHGVVVAEGWWTPYGPRRNHMLYSLSKSFTSTAVGFAVSEGKLSVDDRVTSFFPNDLPESVSDHLAELRVKHLLTMSVGHAEDSSPIIQKEQNWVKTFLALPIANQPGAVFLYNSGASYMLSAIVQKVTGQKVIDYLRPRLFSPLEIHGMTWETCPRGINTGGWGLSIQTEGLAKFGQFYLQHGAWNGRQLLPAAWVREATTFKIQQSAVGKASLAELKVTSDWHHGYCYQFWRCRHNAFRGDGAYGQFTIVMPEQDAVVVITAETADMQGELNLVWKHLLPAVKETALPTDPSAHSELTKRLGALALLPPKGETSSPVAKRISGKIFQLDANPEGLRGVQFQFHHGRCIFKATDANGDYPIICGFEKWIEGSTNFPGTPPRLTRAALHNVKIAASATWTDENTFVMTWRFYETPHHDTVTCKFDGNDIRIEVLSSIAAHASHPIPNMVWSGHLAA